jgi:hypothetical protein
VGHFDDDGELGPDGIETVERRAHAPQQTLARSPLGVRPARPNAKWSGH